MGRALTAVVTAGGTREPIDDVRVVTNLSRGWFGAAIARALAERGVRVTLIGSRDLAREAHRIDPRVRLVPFDAFTDLARALDAETATPPDLLFMAAAVSDYSPVRATGKLRSDQDALVVHMTKNPKLLASLRARCGPASTLVGFKLLSGVTREQLVAVAAKQARDNGLDLTVANDLQRLGGDAHPVALVAPDGSAEDLDGHREAVADAIVARVLARRGVEAPARLVVSAPMREDFHRTTLARWGLGWPGVKVAVVREDGALEATLGRAAVVARLVDDDALAGPADSASGALATRPREPSAGEPSGILARADLEAAAWLARRIAGVDAFARVPAARGLVLPTVVVDRPSAPGLAEARAVHGALARAAQAGRWTGGAFACRLHPGDGLLGLPSDVARVAGVEGKIMSAWAGLLARAGGVVPAQLATAPVFSRDGLTGLLVVPDRGASEPLLTPAGGRADTPRPARLHAPAWVAPFIADELRGRGHGDALAREVDRRGWRVVAPLASAPFWVARGFRPLARLGPDLAPVALDLAGASLDRLGPPAGPDRPDPTTPEAPVLLEPPSVRDDLLHGASILLVDPLSRRVLLGRRRSDPWRGAWSVPGGRIEAGETPLGAALRELTEETGIEAPSCEPVAEHEVVAGASGRAFRIRCFVLLALGAPAARETDELEPAWVPLDEACDRSPLTPGLRALLRGLR